MNAKPKSALVTAGYNAFYVRAGVRLEDALREAASVSAQVCNLVTVVFNNRPLAIDTTTDVEKLLIAEGLDGNAVSSDVSRRNAHA